MSYLNASSFVSKCTNVRKTPFLFAIRNVRVCVSWPSVFPHLSGLVFVGACFLWSVGFLFRLMLLFLSCVSCCLGSFPSRCSQFRTPALFPKHSWAGWRTRGRPSAEAGHSEQLCGGLLPWEAAPPPTSLLHSSSAVSNRDKTVAPGRLCVCLGDEASVRGVRSCPTLIPPPRWLFI